MIRAPRERGYLALLDVCYEEVHHDLPDDLFADDTETDDMDEKSDAHHE
ncbi:hypothetical protein ACVMIH_000073 [Bradyrhizobium sp. USDA 4503]